MVRDYGDVCVVLRVYLGDFSFAFFHFHCLRYMEFILVSVCLIGCRPPYVIHRLPIADFIC